MSTIAYSKQRFPSGKLSRIFRFSLILVVLVSILFIPQSSASANWDWLVCAKAFNSYNAEKGEWFASTVEEWPNRKGEHCSRVEVGIWYGISRKAYGRGYNGYIARVWYSDLPCISGAYHYSFHWAQTNETLVIYQVPRLLFC